MCQWKRSKKMQPICNSPKVGHFSIYTQMNSWLNQANVIDSWSTQIFNTQKTFPFHFILSLQQWISYRIRVMLVTKLSMKCTLYALNVLVPTQITFKRAKFVWIVLRLVLNMQIILVLMRIKSCIVVWKCFYRQHGRRMRIVLCLSSLSVMVSGIGQILVAH